MVEGSSPQRGDARGGSVGFVAALLGALVCFVGCAAEVAALGRPHKASTAVLAAVAVGFGVGAGGAAVFDAYGDQLAATDRGAADAAYRRAAELQRSFASCATSGGEGLARSEIADRMDAKCHSSS